MGFGIVRLCSKYFALKQLEAPAGCGNTRIRMAATAQAPHLGTSQHPNPHLTTQKLGPSYEDLVYG